MTDAAAAALRAAAGAGRLQPLQGQRRVPTRRDAARRPRAAGCSLRRNATARSLRPSSDGRQAAARHEGAAGRSTRAPEQPRSRIGDRLEPLAAFVIFARAVAAASVTAARSDRLVSSARIASAAMQAHQAHRLCHVITSNCIKERLDAQKVTYLLTFCPNGGTMIQHINGTYVPICQQIRDFRGAHRHKRGFGGQGAAGARSRHPPILKPPPQRRTTEGGTNTPHLNGGGLPAPRPREGGHKPPQRAERSAANGSGISATSRR